MEPENVRGVLRLNISIRWQASSPSTYPQRHWRISIQSGPN